MRGYYLNPTHSDGGCRGGVGSKYDECDGYEVEIGGRCYCSSTMMALMVHCDEVAEFLKLSKSPIAAMLLQSLTETKTKIDNLLEEKERKKCENAS